MRNLGGDIDRPRHPLTIARRAECLDLAGVIAARDTEGWERGYNTFWMAEHHFQPEARS
jgi:hypothetical protein